MPRRSDIAFTKAMVQSRKNIMIWYESVVFRKYHDSTASY